MLSTNVKSIGDLMSIALQAEREAIRRYTYLATIMREGENESAAALFDRMVIEEQEHEHLLIEWMSQEGIKENANIGPISWKDPKVSTTYNDDACDSHYSSPYRALAFAVHNEEIAFSFYTHVAANSENETVRKYAEILAREELGHAALLRAERRLAYHKERDASLNEPRLDPNVIHSETDLLVAAIHIDRYLVDQMNSIIASNPALDHLAKEIQQQIKHNEEALSKKLKANMPPSEDTNNNIEQLRKHNAFMEKKFNKPDMQLQRLWSCSDRSFAFYDAIVDKTTDENILLAAQSLSSTALNRIGVLKKTFGDSSV